MPHVIVKLWPGKTDRQKKQLTNEITRVVGDVLDYQDDSISVAFQEVEASDWKEEVYQPDILEQEELLYKKPGYRM